METGDTYVLKRDLLWKTLTLSLSLPIQWIDPPEVAPKISYLIAEDKVQQIDTKIFDNTASFSLRKVRRDTWFVSLKKENKSIMIKTLQKHIKLLSSKSLDEYDNIQKQALCDVIQNMVFILWQVDLVGKRQLLSMIIALFTLLEGLDTKKKSNLPILFLLLQLVELLVAWMMTGLPSATIHRHLGMTEVTMIPVIWKILYAETLSSDEFSMVDTWLANQLFSNISSITVRSSS